MRHRPLITRKAAMSLIADASAARARWHAAVDEATAIACDVTSAAGTLGDANARTERARRAYELACRELYGRVAYFAERQPTPRRAVHNERAAGRVGRPTAQHSVTTNAARHRRHPEPIRAEQGEQGMSTMMTSAADAQRCVRCGAELTDEARCGACGRHA
jgi:hypothetical protein